MLMFNGDRRYGPSVTGEAINEDYVAVFDAFSSLLYEGTHVSRATFPAAAPAQGCRPPS